MSSRWKQRAAAAMLLSLLVLCTACGQGYRHISKEEALHRMESPRDLLIVDVRTREEYEKSHVPGAVLVPIEDIRQGNLDALPDKNQELLLYCWTGRRSEESAVLLAKLGYRNVYEFGGLVDWTGPVEEGRHE